MNRRELMALTASAAFAPVAWPWAAGAQRRAKIPRVGIIDDAPVWNDFRQALRDAGYVEGQTIAFEYRTTDGKPEGLAAAAAELARLPVDVIATYGTPAGRAAKAATTTVPIVAISVGDPVRAGLVQSLAHPGGNVTGNTILGPDLGPKRLQLLKEVIPSVARVAFLWNPDNESNVVMRDELRAAAPGLGLHLILAEARSTSEFAPAFQTILNERADAILTTNDFVHQRNIGLIMEFTTRNRMPGMFQSRDSVVAGGLMSYGATFAELFRHGASYVQKILQGAKPEDLPVRQPERFELIINLKTAKAFGLNIAESFLLRADEVIE
jgi:putative ABC transport system substrate-binding protein